MSIAAVPIIYNSCDIQLLRRNSSHCTIEIPTSRWTISVTASETDGFPLSFLSWISFRPALNFLYHFRTCWMNIHRTLMFIKCRVCLINNRNRHNGQPLSQYCESQRTMAIDKRVWGNRRASGVARFRFTSFPVAEALWEPYFFINPGISTFFKKMSLQQSSPLRIDKPSLRINVLKFVLS